VSDAHAILLDAEQSTRVMRSLVRWRRPRCCAGPGATRRRGSGCTLRWARPGLGLDSLDLIGLSTTVAERFDLYASGAEDGLLRRPTIARWARLARGAMACAGPGASLVFRTSASTGEASAHRHALRALADEAAAFAALLPDTRRVLAMAPGAPHLRLHPHGAAAAGPWARRWSTRPTGRRAGCGASCAPAT
jgi:hypothetical protein